LETSPKRKQHRYNVALEWTGNLGDGTSSYVSYQRSHIFSSPAKSTVIHGSSDPAFRGESSRYNPEELLIASAAGCHMLWYLHLCADAGVQITSYRDSPTGELGELESGSGHVTSITLSPHVVVSQGSMIPLAESLHDTAHRKCFIANSLKCPIHINCSFSVTESTPTEPK
jgi:organic hydroperoxide reductase OsmC/OhrA